MGNIFEARELWQSMGVPYLEPDIVVYADAPVVITMVYACTLKGHVNLAASVTPPSTDLKPAGELLVDASVSP